MLNFSDYYSEYGFNFDTYQIDEMAKVGFVPKYNYLIGIYKDQKRIGEPYFKIFNATNFESADKVIRLSLLKNKVIYHKNTDGKSDLILNSKQFKQLNTFLSKNNVVFPKITNWEFLVLVYNKECGADLIHLSNDDIMKVNNGTYNKNVIPFNSPQIFYSTKAYV